MYSFLCDLTFLIENIIREDIFLREDLSVAKILYSKINGERNRILQFRFLYGKHFHRNFHRYLIFLLISFVMVMLIVYGQFNKMCAANSAIAIICSGLIVYWRFSTNIIDRFHAFRLNFEVHNLIRSVREHSRLSRTFLKFNQSYENILNQNNLENNDQSSSSYQFIWTSWRQLSDSIRLEQVEVNKEMFRNIQYLVKYARISEDFELCFLNNMQTIIIENLLLSELCDLFLLLQSNFFLVLVLSLCNRVNLQSDSTLKQLVVNLNCMIRNSNRKLKSDYENMKSLSSPEPEQEPEPLPPSETCKCSILNNAIEWITRITSKIVDQRKTTEQINFEEIKFKKLIFDLIVKFKVTHSVILNIEQISKRTVNESMEKNAKGESINSKYNQIEKNLTLLNNLFSECKNLIALLNSNCLKSTRRNEIVRGWKDNELQRNQQQVNDDGDIPDANDDNNNDHLEDQVYQLPSKRRRSTRTRIKNYSQTVSPHLPNTDNLQFLNELKQVLKSRASDWNRREQIALERDNCNNLDPILSSEDTTETTQEEDVTEEDQFEYEPTRSEEEQEVARMIAINEEFSKILLESTKFGKDNEVYTYDGNSS